MVSLRQRRLALVLAITTALVGAAALGYMSLGPEKTAELVHWQLLKWQCQNYAGAPDEVIVKASGARRFGVASPPSWWSDITATAEPHIWDRETAPVFLHQLTARSGESRIVCLFVPPDHATSSSANLVNGTVVVSGDRHTIKRISTDVWVYDLTINQRSFLSWNRSLTIYAAQPEPHDSNRFRIIYERDGVRGSLLGWLRDDGQLEFQPIGLAGNDADGDKNSN